MSKMTSSASLTMDHSKPKFLTDFSIQTLIGAEPPSQSTATINSVHHPNFVNTYPNQLKPNMLAAAAELESRSVVGEPAAVGNKKFRPKNFQCPTCRMAFSNNGQLKNHVRIHTGERPFMCNHIDCNKTFTRNEELTRHKLIHTGVRPHSCTTCGKRFGRKDHLKKHVKTHERKRLRKKVFVASHAISRPGARFPPKDHSIFAVPPTKPSKLASNNNIHSCGHPTTQQHQLLMHPPSSVAASDLKLPTTSNPCDMPSLYTPITNSTVISHNITTASMCPPFTQDTTSSAIQQLATDYWNKWYNLMGFYQNYRPTATHSLSDLFKKS